MRKTLGNTGIRDLGIYNNLGLKEKEKRKKKGNKEKILAYAK